MKLLKLQRKLAAVALDRVVQSKWRQKLPAKLRVPAGQRYRLKAEAWREKLLLHPLVAEKAAAKAA